MKTNSLRMTALFFASAAIAAMLTATNSRATAQPQPGGSAALGGSLFKTYCASCHGTSARGDGPLAEHMRRPPANLTEIARRNKGAYPKDLVYRIIDGRQRVPGQGGPDMPVWGDAFMRTSDAADEASVRHRIQALVDYLEAIQSRDGR